MTKYPEPKNERGAIARLVCMADDLAADMATATRTLEELHAELGKLFRQVVQEYPDSCFEEPPPVTNRIPMPDDDDPLAYKRIID